MSLMLATLCLNELEHLPKLYEQHKDWPGLSKWVFVEAADTVYARENPQLVTPKGLSTDGTSGYLQGLAQGDPRVTYVPYGFTSHKDPAQGKIAARQKYIDLAERITPWFIGVIDADEFYTRLDQESIWNTIRANPLNFSAFMFRQRHIWRPESLMGPQFRYEVTGGYWDVPHCRFWRWSQGLKYLDHNSLFLNGKNLRDQTKRFDLVRGTPECVHLGFASIPKLRQAKHRYYIARGEGAGDGRQVYVSCRRAFETWKPGDVLPHGAKVVPYQGPIPEVFLQEPSHAPTC